jgi:Brain and reproductive organ-expressed protein (BRE)
MIVPKVQTLRREWAGRPLAWSLLLGAPGDALSTPDIVFDDASFQPLAADCGHAPELKQLLDGWTGADDAELSRLLELLLKAYSQHQRQRVALLGDERLNFELALLDDLGCVEVALSGAF